MADGQAHTHSAAKPQQEVNSDVWSALRAAQEEFGAISKTTKGARAKYAPLDEVLETLRPVLVRHGLTTTATNVLLGERLFVQRTLYHAQSGTAIEGGPYPVAHVDRAPQEMGSALTYARRYTLLEICDVHPSDEDDDGEKANAKPVAARKSAYALKREDVWPPLIKALKLVETSAEFEAWKTAHAETVAQFPDAWIEQLDEEIEKHRDHLKEQRRIAREAAEHV